MVSNSSGTLLTDNMESNRALPYILISLTGIAILLNIMLLIWQCLKFKPGQGFICMKFALGFLDVAYIITGISMACIVLYEDTLSLTLCKAGGFFILFSTQISMWALATSCVCLLLWKKKMVDQDLQQSNTSIFFLVAMTICVILGIVSFLPMLNIQFFDTTSDYYFVCAPLRLPGEQSWAYSAMILVLSWVAIALCFVVLLAISVKFSSCRNKDIDHHDVWSVPPPIKTSTISKCTTRSLYISLFGTSVGWFIILLVLSISYFAHGGLSRVTIQWVLGYCITVTLILYPVIFAAATFMRYTKRCVQVEDNYQYEHLAEDCPKNLESFKKVKVSKDNIQKYVVQWRDRSGRLTTGVMKVFPPAVHSKWKNEANIINKLGLQSHRNIAKYFWLSSENNFNSAIGNFTGDVISKDMSISCRLHFPNGTLADFLKNKVHNLTEIGVHKITLDIANALEYLQQRQIVHNKLTTETVFMASTSEKIGLKVAIGDFENSYEVLPPTKERQRARQATKAWSDNPSPDIFTITSQLGDQSLKTNTYAPDIRSLGLIVLELLVTLGEFNSKKQPQVPPPRKYTKSCSSTDDVTSIRSTRSIKSRSSLISTKSGSRLHDHTHAPSRCSNQSKCSCSTRVTEVRAHSADERKSNTSNPTFKDNDPNLPRAFIRLPKKEYGMNYPCQTSVDKKRKETTQHNIMASDSRLLPMGAVSKNAVDLDFSYVPDEGSQKSDYAKPWYVDLNEIRSLKDPSLRKKLAKPANGAEFYDLQSDLIVDSDGELKPPVPPRPSREHMRLQKQNERMVPVCSESEAKEYSSDSEAETVIEQRSTQKKAKKGKSAERQGSSVSSCSRGSRSSRVQANKPDLPPKPALIQTHNVLVNTTSDKAETSPISPVSSDQLYDTGDSRKSSSSSSQGVEETIQRSEVRQKMHHLPPIRRHRPPPIPNRHQRYQSQRSLNESILSGDSGMYSSQCADPLSGSESHSDYTGQIPGSRSAIYETDASVSDVDTYSLYRHFVASPKGRHFGKGDSGIESAADSCDDLGKQGPRSTQEWDNGSSVSMAIPDFKPRTPISPLSHSSLSSPNDTGDSNSEDLYSRLSDVKQRKRFPKMGKQPCVGYHKIVKGKQCQGHAMHPIEEEGNRRKHQHRRHASDTSSLDPIYEKCPLQTYRSHESPYNLDSKKDSISLSGISMSSDAYDEKTDRIVEHLFSHQKSAAKTVENHIRNNSYQNQQQFHQQPSSPQAQHIENVSGLRLSQYSLDSAGRSNSKMSQNSLQEECHDSDSVYSAGRYHPRDHYRMRQTSSSVTPSVLSLLNDSQSILDNNSLAPSSLGTPSGVRSSRSPSLSSAKQVKSHDPRPGLGQKQLQYCASLAKKHPSMVHHGTLLSANQQRIANMLNTMKQQGKLGFTATQLMPLLSDCWVEDPVPSAEEILTRLAKVLPTATV